MNFYIYVWGIGIFGFLLVLLFKYFGEEGNVKAMSKDSRAWILISSVAVLVLLAKLAGDSEDSENDDLKALPRKYPYIKHRHWTNGSLASSKYDFSCMLDIQQYYSAAEKDSTLFLPSCFEIGIAIGNPVYIIRYEPDSISAYIAYFYKGPNGRERKFKGYILRSTIHDKPLSKDRPC
ncbi:MAG: hypothetical protein ABIS36_05620 [Chryseolinea sp.]